MKELQQLITEKGDLYSCVYFDTELTRFSSDATIISIGLVDNFGRSFYAEFTDYDESQVTMDVLREVIKGLQHPDAHLEGMDWAMTGTRKEIAPQIMFWLDPIVKTGRVVQFVSWLTDLQFTKVLELLCADNIIKNRPNFIMPVSLDLMNLFSTWMEPKKNKEGVSILRKFNPLAGACALDEDLVVKEYLGENIKINYRFPLLNDCQNHLQAHRFLMGVDPDTGYH